LKRLLGLLGLSAEVVRGGSAVEVAREDRLEEGAIDDLGTVGLGKSHPKDEDELEGVVEGEPVDGVDSAFKDSQESINDPIGEPLSVIGRLGREQRFQRVVGGDRETDGVHQKVGSNVEEDEEEVEGSQAKNDIDLWHIGLLLEIGESWVLSELLIELGDGMLGTIL